MGCIAALEQSQLNRRMRAKVDGRTQCHWDERKGPIKFIWNKWGKIYQQKQNNRLLFLCGSSDKKQTRSTLLSDLHFSNSKQGWKLNSLWKHQILPEAVKLSISKLIDVLKCYPKYSTHCPPFAFNSVTLINLNWFTKHFLKINFHK